MGNNITNKLKYKESVVKFSYKYGVTKASIKFCECRRTIYRWRARYDGTLESLKDKSKRPHSHPNQHTEEEIKLIRNYKNNNKETGLAVRNIEKSNKEITRKNDAVVDYEYKFNIVKDSDIVKPDTTGYIVNE